MDQSKRYATPNVRTNPAGRPGWTAVIGARFAVVFGVALFLAAFAAALYVVWIRMIGLDPSVAQAFDDLSSPIKTALAVGVGAFVGLSIQATSSLESGVATVTLLAASAFVGLMAFELVNHREPRVPWLR